jgi:hypothetical protein
MITFLWWCCGRKRREYTSTDLDEAVRIIFLLPMG